MPKYEYSSNNSGGSWWLKEKHWRALEAAGWEVDWRDEEWLGTKATSATIEAPSAGCAIAMWEDATGLDFNERGCSCCGSPHYISEAWSE